MHAMKQEDQGLEKWFSNFLQVFGGKPEDYERYGNTWTPSGEFLSPDPGVVFRKTDGKLFAFGKDEVMVLRATPQPRAWIKSRSFPYWRSVRPNSFPLHWEGRTACRRFVSSVAMPPDGPSIVDRCDPSIGWGILKLLAAEPSSAIELCQDGFAALVALAYYHPVFTTGASARRSFDVARRLLRQRRRDILKICGFPADCVNIMRRIPIGAISLMSLRTLRKVLSQCPNVKKQLLHLSDAARLTKHVFVSLARYPQYLTQLLVSEMGRKGARKVFPLLRDISEMRNLLGIQGMQARFRSLREMETTHDRLIRQIEGLSLKNLAFPEPPFEDGEVAVGATRVRIRSLSSGLELAEHARRAVNCSASYGGAVSQGHAWLLEAWSLPYSASRLHTICIRPDTGGRWRLAEIAMQQNEPADKVVRDAVLQFLSSRQQHSSEPQPEQPVRPAFDMNLELMRVGDADFAYDELQER